MSPDDLKSIAPLFTHIATRSSTAKPSYQMFTHAIVWDDEEPELESPVAGYDAFRAVLHHRSCLMLGLPSEYSEYWDLAKTLFPKWIGFLPERSTYSPELERLFNTGAEQSRKFVRDNISKPL